MPFQKSCIGLTGRLSVPPCPPINILHFQYLQHDRNKSAINHYKIRFLGVRVRQALAYYILIGDIMDCMGVAETDSEHKLSRLYLQFR